VSGKNRLSRLDGVRPVWVFDVNMSGTDLSTAKVPGLHSFNTRI